MVMQAYTGKSNLISYEYYMKIKQELNKFVDPIQSRYYEHIIYACVRAS